MKAADKTAIHRLLMESPMVSAREIAKTLIGLGIYLLEKKEKKYGEYVALVVMADGEANARALAKTYLDNRGLKNDPCPLAANPTSIWLDDSYTTCKCIEQGVEKVIYAEYTHG